MLFPEDNTSREERGPDFECWPLLRNKSRFDDQSALSIRSHPDLPPLFLTWFGSISRPASPRNVPSAPFRPQRTPCHASALRMSATLDFRPSCLSTRLHDAVGTGACVAPPNMKGSCDGIGGSRPSKLGSPPSTSRQARHTRHSSQAKLI